MGQNNRTFFEMTAFLGFCENLSKKELEVQDRMNRMRLRAGIPDNDNRDYLPEKLKGTDIVVNENGNNSQPYPKRLKEYHGVIADGIEDEWYVYVPESYQKQAKTPLVISMHGGLMTGWGQAVYTSWTLAADRDGFIVLFPNASRNRVWQVQWGRWEADPDQPGPDSNTQAPESFTVCPEDVSQNHDIRFVLGLIDRMKAEYNIDEGRIFMQGMSMGNMMTSLFARYYGNVLAGAAGSACAGFLSLLFDKEEKIKNQGGPVAIWQSRPELNNIPPEKEEALKVNKYNRLYWMRINDCETIPQIKIEGEYNFAFYNGKKADLVYLDIKNRDHGQTFDDAALIWDYLFSGVYRNSDGRIMHAESVKPRKGDSFAISVAENLSNAWLNGRLIDMGSPAVKWQKVKYHGLEGGQKVRGEYLCVPLSFIEHAFDAKLEYGENNCMADLKLPDGREVQFARGSIGCVIEQSLHAMYCEALLMYDELYISVEWFCRFIMNLHVSSCDGVWYITDHFNELSANMADLIRDLMRGMAVPENYQEMLDN